MNDLLQKIKRQQRHTSTVPIRNQPCDPHVHTSLTLHSTLCSANKHGCFETGSGFACTGPLSPRLTRAGLCATAKSHCGGAVEAEQTREDLVTTMLSLATLSLS